MEQSQSQSFGGQSQSQGAWPYPEPLRPEVVEGVPDAPEDPETGAAAGAALPAGGAATTGTSTTGTSTTGTPGALMDSYPLREVPQADNVGGDGALESGADNQVAPPPAAHEHRAIAPDPLHHAPRPDGTVAARPAMAVANARKEENHRRIAELAYRIAEAQHFAPGQEERNWYEAERRLGLSNTASEAF